MTSGVNVPLIELINAGIEDRNGVRQINGITFNVTRGEFVCLQGPTGSGKSLALNMIAGIKRPSFGQIFVAGDCINDFKSEGNTIYNELIGVIDGFKGIINDAQNDTYDFSDFKEKLAAVKGNFEIGDYENIYIGMEPALVTGVISVGTGLNLYIDSLAWDPSVGYQLGVGTHVISFDVTTGYDGTNATITFNGQTVKNGGTIEITSDMTTFTLMVSGAVPSSGQVVIENGGDSGSLGLTDYLLIVLVILIVIMAIIVATRLMRS